jgi:hypothetical protein
MKRTKDSRNEDMNREKNTQTWIKAIESERERSRRIATLPATSIPNKSTTMKIKGKTTLKVT